MIEIRNMEKTKFRTFGWVQNCSNFSELCDVVSIFNEKTKIYKELLNKKISENIEEKDGRERLINSLKIKPLKLKYIDLVGTSFKPRSSARCNGIVQAIIKGQQKSFTDNWTADNYIRWANCLGFLNYNYSDDTFEITEKGLKFTESEDDAEKNKILEDAFLSYPPVIRILTLLENGQVKTKFELGKKLGFVQAFHKMFLL